MRRKAETVNFVPGGRWDERSVGTNALDLANRTGDPSMVFSAEHYASIVHNWVCWAAPVHDPVSGEQLGVIDLSTTWDRTHPIGLATARVMARLIETAMPHSGGAPASRPSRPTEPGPHAVAPRHRRGLARRATAAAQPPADRDPGAARACTRTGSRSSTCTPWSTATTAVTTSTLKAEVSHLRSALGGQLASRPYRLTLPVATDIDEVPAAAAPRRRARRRRGVRRRPAARHQRARPWSRWATTSRSACARRCWPTPTPRPCCATASSRRTTPQVVEVCLARLGDRRPSRQAAAAGPAGRRGALTRAPRRRPRP